MVVSKQPEVIGQVRASSKGLASLARPIVHAQGPARTAMHPATAERIRLQAPEHSGHARAVVPCAACHTV